VPFLPGVAGSQTRQTDRPGVHGDFGWHDLTSPDCVILDWEDWGMAPRGYDAAILWHTSFAIPALADSRLPGARVAHRPGQGHGEARAHPPEGIARRLTVRTVT